MLCALFALDQLNLYRAAAPTAPAASQLKSANPHRGYVLFVDSLRYETARDPRLMPNLVELEKSSVFAKAIPPIDAMSITGTAAAFTGEAELRLFNLVSNFVEAGGARTSVFSQLGDYGRGCRVYGDRSSFAQFGFDRINFSTNTSHAVWIEHEEPWRVTMRAQNATLLHSLDEHCAGDSALTVFHASYTDHASHQFGIDNDSYRLAFRTLDKQLGQVIRKLPSDDFLCIFGDHGHTPEGRHKMGNDVPTYLSCRGPGLRPNTDLGTIQLVDTRYFLSWALQIPLPQNYGNGSYPQALSGNVPESFRASVSSAKNLGAPAAAYGLAAVLFGLLAGAWLLRTSPRKRLIIVCAAAALVLFFWGGVLARGRPWIHEPAFETVLSVWRYVLIAGALLCLWLRATTVAWVLFTMGWLFGYPSVYRYGNIANIGVFWCVFAALLWLQTAPRLAGGRWRSLLLVAPVAILVWFPLDDAHLQLGAVSAALWLVFCFADLPVPYLPTRVRRQLAALAQVALLISYGKTFWVAEGSQHQLESFVPAFYLDQTAWPWLALGFVAKLVIFTPRRGSRLVRVPLGLACAALLHVIQTRTPSIATLAAIAALLAAGSWLLSRQRKNHPAIGTLLLTLLLVVVHFTIRPPRAEEAVWHLESILAILVLAASLCRVRFGEHGANATSRVLLAILTMVAVAWPLVEWRASGLEWNFLYDFVDQQPLEKHVAYFVPLILVRYLLVVFVIRRLLTRELGPPGRDRVWLVAAAMALAVVPVCFGIASVLPTSHVFSEAVQQICIVVVLTAGFITTRRPS